MYIMGTLTEKEALHRSRATCLENVKNLNCWGTNLSDISIVRKMVNLQVLNLSANNVSTLKDVAFCPRLKELYLRRNQVKSVDEIKYLKNLKHLSVLWIADNPISMNPSYREIVLKNLTNLKKLDSQEVTQEERNIINTKNVIKFDDDDLPNFDNLNLNKTLTMQEVNEISSKHTSSKFVRSSSSGSNPISMFSKPTTQYYQEQKIFKEEMQPKIDLNLSGQVMGYSQNTSTINDNTTPIPMNGNTAKSSSPNNLTSREKLSNTLSAIMLLTNDLHVSELKELSLHVNNLLTEQSQTLSLYNKHEKEKSLLTS